MPDMVARPDIVRDNPNVPKFHSNFQLKETRLTTEQFGLIKPHMIIDDVSSDNIDYRPEYRTRSYTLKAPLMQDVHRKLSYIKVDLSSILPFNYEKFYTNPVIGDDVPNDCGCVLSGGYKLISDAVISRLNFFISQLNGANNFTPLNLTEFFKVLIFGELFYSRGSLLSSLGSHIAKQFYCVIPNDTPKVRSFDYLFDLACSRVLAMFTPASVSTITVRFGSVSKYVEVSAIPQTYAPDTISFREFLNEIRTSADWEITAFGGPTPVSISSSFVFAPVLYSRVSDDVPFNFGRVCAYQLAVAEYMTNDKVDHIYSAELYRQYIGSLVKSVDDNTGVTYVSYPSYFVANGISYQYDFLSGNYMYQMLNYFKAISSFSSNPAAPSCIEYFISLFSFKRSLRYKDYFVSSRVRPLAVGDVSVSVNNNLVSVVDVSRKIQAQRFLNAVNHSGRRLSNYIKTFFGIDISPDRHVPHWLADIDEMVYTAEVENTGVAQQTNQNSVTATFTGNSGNKQLRFYADLPGYIIGLTSYDIERSYADTINRSFFIQDRFDMFIPELQFVGDQAVLSHELDSSDTRSFGSAFGYQYRDMQYKLFYSIADGGFVENLPGFGFIFKPGYFSTQNISPDFIRSRVSELDEFYLSLTGYSLGSYFHFISMIVNNFSAKRPMIANPKILE